MPASERTLLTVAGVACVACCLPLVVAAGPVVAVGGAVIATAGMTAHLVRRSKRKRVDAEPSADR